MRTVSSAQDQFKKGTRGSANRLLRSGFILRLFLIALLSVTANSLYSAQPAGLHISEFMASNDTTHPDNADLDDYSDWIELHNPTANPVPLAQYYLTDDLTAPTKWAFPANSVIPANGFLVVRADDGNAGPGDVRFREFSPWDPFTNIFHHTNFKLSSSGESIGLNRFDGEIQSVDLISPGANWSYFDKGTDPGTNWTSALFDDSGWSNGAAQLGYGENDEATEPDYGNDSQQKHPAYYFRRKFQVNSTSDLRQLELQLLADDGAIVYLNGSEIFRFSMPAGDVDYTTHALGLAAENVFVSTNIPVSLLLAGENTVAVEVHQRNDTSSDVSFDFEMTAVRLIGNPVAVDSVVYGQQYPDVSFARNPDDDGNWYYYGEPTPNAPNTTFPTLTPVPPTPVEFSVPNGFHTGPLNVSLTTTSGAAMIHYTLDGSVPGSGSPDYIDPIPISATTVLRARTYEPGKIPGPVATRTYFINEPDRDLPVVSFVVEPDEFFDAIVGICTNVYKGREAAIHLEYFDENAELGFAVNAGSKIAGENIWRFAQKPLTVTLRGKYGSESIDYQFFSDERTGKFGQIVFRNGGDNWPNAMLRDAMTPHILKWKSEDGIQSLAERQDELNEIKQFALGRAAHVRAGISNHLGLSATAELTINVVPENGGIVKLHGVPMLPQYTNTARLYRDIPLEIEVESAPGFDFDNWSDGLGNSESIVLTLTGDQTLTATFVASPESLIPETVDTPPQPSMTRQGNLYEIVLPLAADLEGVSIELLSCSTLNPPDWQPVTGFVIEPVGNANQLRATVSSIDPQMYFQLRVAMQP